MQETRLFKALPNSIAYFSFQNEEEAPKLSPGSTNVFVKIGKGKIRKLGGEVEVTWRKNSQVTYYGQDISDLLSEAKLEE
jgi:hypothetical protein